eukprot:Platyproteum_vivax@DN15804_c0_g1_i1.p1
MSRTLKRFMVGGEEIWCTAELLSNVSEVFEAMLNQESEESSEDVIELPEDDPNAFEKYIKLAKIAISDRDSGGVGYLFEDSILGLNLLKNTYLLAHKYHSTKIIDQLRNLQMELFEELE